MLPCQAQTWPLIIEGTFIYTKKAWASYISLAHGLRSAITSPDERAIADPTPDMIRRAAHVYIYDDAAPTRAYQGGATRCLLCRRFCFKLQFEGLFNKRL